MKISFFLLLLVLDQIPISERNSFCLITLLTDIACTGKFLYKEQIVSTLIETIRTYAKACLSDSLSSGKCLFVLF